MLKNMNHVRPTGEQKGGDLPLLSFVYSNVLEVPGIMKVLTFGYLCRT